MTMTMTTHECVDIPHGNETTEEGNEKQKLLLLKKKKTATKNSKFVRRMIAGILLTASIFFVIVTISTTTTITNTTIAPPVLPLLSSSVSTVSASVSAAASAAASASPVIGIVTQPYLYGNTTSSYIAASYVKWIEVGGGRSIPIPYDATNQTIDAILTQIDGVLFPGGNDASIPPAIHHLWDVVLASYNPNKTRSQTKKNTDVTKEDPTDPTEALLPIWGTCLGFEYLIQLGCDPTAAATILDDDYDATNVSLPLFDVQPYHVYHNPAIYETVQHYNLTMNNHHQGITPQRFMEDPGLSTRWKITSVNYDVSSRHKPFVSTIEPQHPATFPVYGVMYHPEKNTFEHGVNPVTNTPYEAIDHSPAGIALSVYLATFFVQTLIVAQKQKHNHPRSKYTNPTMYPLVYSYPMILDTTFEQRFIIPPSSTTE